MATVIRASVAVSNPFYISKHRYYELKHRCLQYNDWKKRLAVESNQSLPEQRFEPDKTGRVATGLVNWSTPIAQVERCCEEAGGDISKWLLIAVTEGKSYAVLCPPCSKEYFYQRYRKFFYLLDKFC